MHISHLWKGISRGTPITWRLAVAFPLTYYIAHTLSMVLHELGHGLTGILLGGRFEGWYIAPGVIGWSYPFGPVPLPQPVIAWIIAGGTIAECLAGILLLSTAVYMHHRWTTWLPVAFALGGTLAITFSGVNLAVNVLLGWGDGFALTQWGVSPLVPLGAGGVTLGLLCLIELPVVVKTLRPFLAQSSRIDLWTSILVAGLPVQVYSLVKAYVLFDEHAARTLVYTLFFILFSGIGAALTSFRISPDPQPTDGPSMLTLLILFVVVVGLELLCAVYFGFDQILRPFPL